MRPLTTSQALIKMRLRILFVQSELPLLLQDETYCGDCVGKFLPACSLLYCFLQGCGRPRLKTLQHMRTRFSCLKRKGFVMKLLLNVSLRRICVVLFLIMTVATLHANGGLEPCVNCNATGKIPEMGVCQRCNGTNRLTQTCFVCHGRKMYQSSRGVVVCFECGGSGTVWSICHNCCGMPVQTGKMIKCRFCNGGGRTTRQNNNWVRNAREQSRRKMAALFEDFERSRARGEEREAYYREKVKHAEEGFFRNCGLCGERYDIRRGECWCLKAPKYN